MLEEDGSFEIFWTRQPRGNNWLKTEANYCASCNGSSRALFSDEVPASQVSDHWVRKTSYMLEKTLFYQQVGANHTNFTDIMYEDLLSDPMVQLEKIYERYDGISETLRQKFERADAENPMGKYGRHGYNLSDFGLSREELIHKNRSYLNLFNTLRGPTRN